MNLSPDWLLDMHMHVGDAAALHQLTVWLGTEPLYAALPTALDAREAKLLFELIESSPHLGQHLLPAAGLHPWKAEQGLAGVRALEPYLKRTVIVGEIGLDRPWTTIPLREQLTVLRAQLQLAADWSKPILVHSKGYEAELLQELEDYPAPIIVHWYSCSDPALLAAYIDRGVYFTLGPDNGHDADTRLVWTEAPLDRLLIETDGLAAIAWAENRLDSSQQQGPSELLASLRERIASYAHMHQLPVEAVQRQLHQNAQQLLGLH